MSQVQRHRHNIRASAARATGYSGTPPFQLAAPVVHAPQTSLLCDVAGVDHFVQFYETEKGLLDSLRTFVYEGLLAGEAIILIATPEHRDSLRKDLDTAASKVSAAQKDGRYIELDAHGMLSCFMVEDHPDPGLFHAALRPILADALRSHGRVRMFGEMVSLLWQQGHYQAVIRLEELWDDLLSDVAAGHPDAHSRISLFCAYPLNSFGGQNLAQPLQRICCRHGRVIPGESYTALAEPNERNRAVAMLQQKAHTLEAEILSRRQTEMELRRAAAEAEESHRLKDEFLTTVSHELRSPLSAIIGWSEILGEEGVESEIFNQGLAAIHRNARAQAQLIEDLLDMSCIIRGALRLDMKAVDIGCVVDAAITSAQAAAQARCIDIKISKEAGIPLIHADPARLQQVVWNLLSNAIKFTPCGGSIIVQVESGADLEDTLTPYILIQVTDTGQGICPEFLDSLFDRFRQADATTTRKHGGLGLGLAIVRHIVEVHGGSVRAESRGSGHGASFIVQLPVNTRAAG